MARQGAPPILAIPVVLRRRLVVSGFEGARLCEPQPLPQIRACANIPAHSSCRIAAGRRPALRKLGHCPASPRVDSRTHVIYIGSGKRRENMETGTGQFRVSRMIHLADTILCLSRPRAASNLNGPPSGTRHPSITRFIPLNPSQSQLTFKNQYPGQSSERGSPARQNALQNLLSINECQPMPAGAACHEMPSCPPPRRSNRPGVKPKRRQSGLCVLQKYFLERTLGKARTNSVWNFTPRAPALFRVNTPQARPVTTHSPVFKPG